MPYIKQSVRPIAAKVPMNSGQLNYAFTKLIDEYLRDKGKNYTNINDIVGALECCKLELYRRVIGPYEDNRLIENGDVYYGA